ncbi:hypothetical protein [Kribbella sp. NPDC048928]|uniref:hypothetical protein n=1 Tax=Kribbella sp. NPDC048928 TaxID=3364111 RepID=UPI00371E9FAD
MNTTDHWDELKSAGRVPPPSPETLARAVSRLESKQRAPRTLVAVLAAAAATAVVSGGIAAVQAGSGSVAGRPTAVMTIPGTGVAGPCSYVESADVLGHQPFAFDGKVLSTTPAKPYGRLPTYTVTLKVNEWFTANPTSRRVVLAMYDTPGRKDLPYAVGSRLLVTADTGHSSACWFVRPYTRGDASTWRKAFGK